MKKGIKQDTRCLKKINDEIHIGDWCLFKKYNSTKCFLGLILNFAYLEGKSKKVQEYSSHYARVKDNIKEIRIPCNWYETAPNSSLLVSVPMDVHGYINIKQYHITISLPDISESGLRIDKNLYQQIKIYFKTRILLFRLHLILIYSNLIFKRSKMNDFTRRVFNDFRNH